MTTRARTLLAGSAVAAALALGFADAPRAAESWRAALPGHELPLVREHRYRMSGRIRPLLFWIGRDDIGAARLTWRDDRDGRAAFEFLIGTDPERAPRGLNRWGYVVEARSTEGTDVFGVMSELPEKSLKEAEDRLNEGPSLRFVARWTRLTADAALVSSSTVSPARAFTYRDLGDLMPLFAPEGTRERGRRADPASRAGFLGSVAALVGESVRACDRSRCGPPPPPRIYLHGTRVFDLRLTSQRWVDGLEVDGRRRASLVRGRFEARARDTGDETDFEIVYGTRGPLAGVPVAIAYQPKWWLEIRLALVE